MVLKLTTIPMGYCWYSNEYLAFIKVSIRVQVINISFISECPKYMINMKISVTHKMNYNLNVSDIKEITKQWVRKRSTSFS